MEKQLPSYEESRKSNQLVCYYDYTFIVEAKKGYVAIFDKEFCLVDEPIKNKSNYDKICHYWYQVTQNAKKEQETRKENEELELLEMFDMLEMGE